MASIISMASTSKTFLQLAQEKALHKNHIPLNITTPITKSLHFPWKNQLHNACQCPKRRICTVCLVLEHEKQTTQIENHGDEEEDDFGNQIFAMSSFGITAMSVMAIFYRISWQMQGKVVPLSEILGTFALSVGAGVGMEFWSRWVHKAIWHASLWPMHQSHHKPREGVFEFNDVFAIINAVPAIALLYYGSFNDGLLPSLCFGVGLGITIVGIAYVFVHDGLVHNRFPVGYIANAPYFRRVAAAHQLHHSKKFNGIPFGFFLGPKEVEEVGGLEELENEINRRINLCNDS